MSFEVICTGCGAPSGPSVGLCPFCKTVMISPDDENFEQENSIMNLYEHGRLELALSLANKMYSQDENSKKDPAFLLLYAKILLDTEGPSSLIKSILSEAHLISPGNGEVLDYLELIEAKSFLRKGLEDPGEIQLKNLIRRAPKNVHAHFLLGSHLFWVDDQPGLAIPYLETCVRLSPNFLRAWGCLAAIYKKMGNEQLSIRAFQKCYELEQNPTMKAFFKQEIENQK